MKKILTTVLIIVISQIQIFAIFANVELTGKELLMELQMVGPSTTPPGIYAYDVEKDELKIVMPFAKYPKWSPDHKKIAMCMNRDYYVLDIVTKQYEKVKRSDDLCDFVLPEEIKGWLNNDEIYWRSVYNDLTIINQKFKNDKFTMDTYLHHEIDKKLVKRICYIGSKLTMLNNYSDNALQFSDGVSFDVNSGIFAETLQRKKDNFVLSSPYIYIGRIGWENFDFIKCNDDEVIFKPIVQPGGKLIAYEYMSQKTGEVDIKLYDTLEKKSWNFTEIDQVYSDEGNYRLYSKSDNKLCIWLSDGNKLLYRQQGYNIDKLERGSKYLLYDIATKKSELLYDYDGVSELVSSPKSNIIAGISHYYKRDSLIVDSSTVKFIELSNFKYKKTFTIKHFQADNSKYKNMMPVRLDW